MCPCVVMCVCQVKILQQDVATCLCLFVVLTGGFTSAFLILDEGLTGFDGAATYLWTCSSVLFGDTDLLRSLEAQDRKDQTQPHDLEPSSLSSSYYSQAIHDEIVAVKRALNVFLSVTFLFLIGIVLVNLLIAKMGDTCELPPPHQCGL